jgi:hypothetical protein
VTRQLCADGRKRQEIWPIHRGRKKTAPFARRRRTGAALGSAHATCSLPVGTHERSLRSRATQPRHDSARPSVTGHWLYRSRPTRARCRCRAPCARARVRDQANVGRRRSPACAGAILSVHECPRPHGCCCCRRQVSRRPRCGPVFLWPVGCNDYLLSRDHLVGRGRIKVAGRAPTCGVPREASANVTSRTGDGYMSLCVRLNQVDIVGILQSVCTIHDRSGSLSCATATN